MRSFAHRLLAVLALLAASTAASAQTPSPSDVVAGTAAELAATIVARRAELEGNHEALAALVDTLLLPRFDMQRGTRAILAEHWESSAPADRERFAAAFYRYLVASYGDLLLHFKADTLRVLPFDGELAESPVRVHTVLTLNDGTEVDVDFVMLGRDGDWRVVDIVAEGVSYVRTYRSQFRVDIAADGLVSVIEWLEQKAAPRAAPAPSRD
jgi:phospholipid transport system substrate-binding protein